MSYNSDYMAERRESLKAAGLCVSCGQRDPETGHTLCRPCLEMRREDQQSRYWRLKAPQKKQGETVEKAGKLNLLALRAAGGLCFFYPGKPHARKSGRLAMQHGTEAYHYALDLGWAAKAAANASGRDWAKWALPMKGPLALGVTVFRAAPATNKPDLSNYVKLVEDALTTANILCDDAHIVEYFATGKRASKTEGMRIILVPQGHLAALGFGVAD